MIFDDYATLTGTQAASFEASVAQTTAMFAERLLGQMESDLGPVADIAILEVGCGWGRNLLALRGLGARRLAGIDISREQVGLAHAMGLTEVRLASIGDEHLEGSTVDSILALDVIEHLSLDVLEQFCALVRHRLRDGGLLVVRAPNALSPLSPLMSMDVTHLRGFTVNSLRQLFRMCGVTEVFIRGDAYPSTTRSGRARRLLVTQLINPARTVMGRILHGHSEPMWYAEPNLLGMGRKTVVA